MRQVPAAGSLDERIVGNFEFPSDSAEDEVPQKIRRGGHPHMNNLVYGRRSDPAVASHLNQDPSGAICRQVLERCARWQKQPVS